MVARKYLTDIQAQAVEFSDISSSDWYYDYVAKGYTSGIIKGVNETDFAPGNSISRQDIATILYRLMENSGKSASTESEAFSDDSVIASYARDAVYSLRSAGVISGDNGQFRPKDFATRAEVAVMIYRFIQFMN